MCVFAGTESVGAEIMNIYFLFFYNGLIWFLSFVTKNRTTCLAFKFFFSSRRRDQ